MGAPEDDEAAPAEEAALDYEEALDAVGTGKFQWIMLAVCGTGNAADAAELLAMSFVLPAIGPDGKGAFRLSVVQQAVLTSAIFWGALIGTMVWGLLSDIMGRRRAIAAAMALSGGFGLLSATVSTFGSLLFVRVVAGIGVGGSIPVVFSFMAEVLPTATRGRFMVMLASFWMVGSIYTALAGWALVPSDPANGWRRFLVVAALPSVACAIGTFKFAPESPRFLVVQRRGADAMTVLRAAAVMNGRELPRGATLRLPAGGGTHEASRHASGGSAAQMRAWIADAVSTLRVALGPGIRGTTLAMMVVWYGISFGWYGTVLWFPEYFQARATAAHAHDASPPPMSPSAAAADALTAGSGQLDREAYTDQLLVALANLPGNLVSIYLVDSIGRRNTLAVSLVGGGLFALAFAFVPVTFARATVGAACAFNAVSVAAWNALDTYSAEIMPTAVRTTAMGLMGAAGRFGSISAQLVNGKLMTINQWAPLIPGAGVMFVAAAAVVFLLPVETCGKPLNDDVASSLHDDGPGAAHGQRSGGGGRGAALPFRLRGRNKQHSSGGLEFMPLRNNAAEDEEEGAEAAAA